jgi:ABC-type dipeptide/oligopeptide/nickel transport system ATPase component
MNNQKITNPFNAKRFIGYVSKVSPDITQIHFPNSNLLKKFHHEGDVLNGGLVRNFVIIEGEDHGFLAKIISVELPDKDRSFLSEKAFLNDDKMQPIGKVEIQLAFKIFGKLVAKKGLDQYPPVGAKVYACTPKLLALFFKDFGKKSDCDDLLNIANLPQDETCEIKISANALFGRHCAIVGTTGSGKSFTIAKLIEEMLKKSGTKIVLLDATGEFKKLGSNKNQEVESKKFGKEGDIYLGCKNLTESDLFSFFTPAGQVQVPILQKAIKSLKLARVLEEQILNVSTLPQGGLIKKLGQPKESFYQEYNKNISKVESADANFDINKLNLQIDEECIHEDGFDRVIPKFGGEDKKAKENCNSLKMRVSSKLANSDFSHIFGLSEEKQKGKNDFEKCFNEFYTSDDKKLLLIDLSEVESEANLKEILTNSIGRFFFKKSQAKTTINPAKKIFQNKPLILFLDEAHQAFRTEKIKDEYSNEFKLDAFERIAKECRKFGLFLCLSTQRPRDIPQGVLSQMGSFIAHRLINQYDREAIESASPEGSKYVLSFLPSLGEGEAVLMGVDFPTPINLKISNVSNKPSSDTPKLFKNTNQ